MIANYARRSRAAKLDLDADGGHEWVDNGPVEGGLRFWISQKTNPKDQGVIANRSTTSSP